MATAMKRIAVVLTARSSWAKLEPVCRALRTKSEIRLGIVVCGSALLDRYGAVVDVVEDEGYDVTDRLYTVYEGSTLETGAKETGALTNDLAVVLSRLRPDGVVVCADRHEVLAAATAASYLHLPLVHLQGGERSGSVDDKVRDAVTHLADYHCVCTEQAKYRVYGLTGQYERVWNTGCPSVDLAHVAKDAPRVTPEELGGTGPRIDLARRFIVCLQHPVTSEADRAGEQMATTLEALERIAQPRLVFWPGEDAGQEAMSKAIRLVQTGRPHLTIHTKRSLPPVRWLKLLTQASCLVGNSSTGIRECSALGVPVVNIGSRQQGRERAHNVIDVPHEAAAITSAVITQVAHGPYAPSRLYGNGTAGLQTAEILCQILMNTRSIVKS